MGRFDAASFYAQIGASAKEQHALRQDLVRGLKEYYDAAYGYDKYGAETIFMLPERMGEPYIYGFGLLRILHDRRLSIATRTAAARHALEVIDYGADSGLPYGLFAALYYLALNAQLVPVDVRYALVASAGESDPFHGTDRAWSIAFMRWLLANGDFAVEERLFWGHSLLARHGDGAGAAELAYALVEREDFALHDRQELCTAWTHFRQPRLTVPPVVTDGSSRGDFAAEHLPFWVAHIPSWPSATMVRIGLLWLARHHVDPLVLVDEYLGYADTYADQIHGTLVDILVEHQHALAQREVRAAIERGIEVSGSGPVRRRFYRLGADLYGPEYLRRANGDSAGSVRQWAARQLEHLP